MSIFRHNIFVKFFCIAKISHPLLSKKQLFNTFTCKNEQPDINYPTQFFKKYYAI